MRKTIVILGCLGLLSLPFLLAGPAGCFDPELPNVAFQCGENNECPEDYECRDDGCCHKIGSPLDEHGPCSVDVDASVSLDASN